METESLVIKDMSIEENNLKDLKKFEKSVIEQKIDDKYLITELSKMIKESEEKLAKYKKIIRSE